MKTWIVFGASSLVVACLACEGEAGPSPEGFGDEGVADYVAGDEASDPGGDDQEGLTDPGGTDACSPSRLPKCQWNDTPVSCDIAVGRFEGGTATSPRALCESVCNHSPDAIENLNGTRCTSLVPWCWTIADLGCDACCSLSHVPPSQNPEDGDACTLDACAGETCTHQTVDWIGQPCENVNDFGTCRGALACDSWCPPGSTDCSPGTQRCTAAEPLPDVVNGIDDDCDGATDEGTDGGVLQWTQGDGARDPSIAALDDGRFVVAWTDALAGSVWGEAVYRIQVRTGTKASPMGGAHVVLESGSVGSPCVFALPEGRFGLAWVSRDPADPSGSTATQRLRIHRSASDPAESVLDYPITETRGSVDCAHVLVWPQGDFAVTAHDSSEGVSEKVLMQRYDGGGPVGPRFELPGIGRFRERLLAGSDGRILGAWPSASADGMNRATYSARWFDREGAPQGEVFGLTDEVYRSQAPSSGPALAMMADGRVLTSWSGRPVIHDVGQDIRLMPLPWGALPDAPPVPMIGSPTGRQAIVDLSVGKEDVIAFWKMPRDGYNAEGFYATWLSLPDFVSGRSVTLAMPVGGLLADLKTATLSDGTVVVVWVYQHIPQTTFSSSLRVLMVPR